MNTDILFAPDCYTGTQCDPQPQRRNTNNHLHFTVSRGEM